ncbi:ArfGAP with SH3 domain, ankyrin repeat and PH domain 2a [Balamuthia mandrillaris]
MQPAEVMRRSPRRMMIEQDVKLFPSIVGPTRLKLDGLVRHETKGERVCGTLVQAIRKDAVHTKENPVYEQIFTEKQAEFQELRTYTPFEEHNKIIEPEGAIECQAKERGQRSLLDELHSTTETEAKKQPDKGHSTEETNEDRASEAKEKDNAAKDAQEIEGKIKRDEGYEKEGDDTEGTQIACADEQRRDGKDKAKATLQKAIVIHPYEAKDSDEMALFVGETVTILELDGSGWWTGETQDGRYGLFPSSFVQLLGASPSSSSPSPSSSEEEEEEKGRSKTISKEETKAGWSTKKARSATTSPRLAPSSSKRHTSHSFLSASTRKHSPSTLSSSVFSSASSSPASSYPSAELKSASTSSPRRLTTKLVGSIRRRGSTTKGKASTADNISTLLSSSSAASSLDESAPSLFQKEKSSSSSSSSLTPKASSTFTFIASPRGRSFSIRMVAATSAQQPQRRKAKTVGGDKPSLVAPAIRAAQPNGGGWIGPQKGHLRPRASTATLLPLLGHHHRNKDGCYSLLDS